MHRRPLKEWRVPAVQFHNCPSSTDFLDNARYNFFETQIPVQLFIFLPSENSSISGLIEEPRICDHVYVFDRSPPDCDQSGIAGTRADERYAHTHISKITRIPAVSCQDRRCRSDLRHKNRPRRNTPSGGNLHRHPDTRTVRTCPQASFSAP